jgi:hypothetical protein
VGETLQLEGLRLFAEAYQKIINGLQTENNFQSSAPSA